MIYSTTNRRKLKKIYKKETIKTYTSLTKKWKTDPLYFAKLGYAHLYAKDYKSAELNFNKAIKKQPGYYLATSGLSAIKFTKRDIVKDGWSLYYKGKNKDQQKVCEGKKEANDIINHKKIKPINQNIKLTKRVFKKSDFNKNSLEKLTSNLKKGMIKNYLNKKDEIDKLYP